jgi:hypothetical protein
LPGWANLGLFEYRIAFLETYRNFVVLTTQNERSAIIFFVYRPFRDKFPKCNNGQRGAIPHFLGRRIGFVIATDKTEQQGQLMRLSSASPQPLLLEYPPAAAGASPCQCATLTHTR